MRHVVLTGATGFVGKVVLEHLVRRGDCASITLIVRISDSQSAASRLRTVVASPLFASQPPGWEAIVGAVAGDLARPGCGLSLADRTRLVARTTHVIHCAASVEFDLPIAEATAANVTTALEVLELARACPALVSMVSVSTAYVTAWHDGPIDERLAPLPAPAAELLARAERGDELLAVTGHPNTYTLTKCLAEHLLAERRGAVPLTIVRPSIVSAAWRAPMPGWIDSTAALAGCLLYVGLGVVRAWQADPAVRLDVVPVDVVADEILDAAFGPAPTLAIRHATMGLEHALRIDRAIDATTTFFRERPGAKRVPGLFVGTAGFAREDLVRRELPVQLARLLSRDRRRIEKADRQVRYLNSAFAYFTHRTFDFRRARAVARGFDPVAYLDVVLRGMHRHLVRRDPTQESLLHADPRSMLAWASDPARDGNLTIRALGVGLRAALRRCTSDVTFDRPALERALARVPADAIIVLAPSHRSYLDFLLASYLCFAHPELGIPVPHIAAAEEFSRIPIVGRVLRQARAFYVKRGVGREAPELSDELRRLAARGASLMFFVEGQRSRARLTLPPKRGLLRGLQATGRTFALLPVAFSYDRLPEEQALASELAGGGKPRMRLAPLLAWLGKLARGQVELGRVHLACGEPIVLDPSTDVHAASRALVAEHQRHGAVSSFHLRAFLAEARLDPSIDEAWLSEAIRARGGRVLASTLEVPPLSPVLAQTLRNQWSHWFHGDALALYPESAAVRDHVERHAWATGQAGPFAGRVLQNQARTVRGPFADPVPQRRNERREEGFVDAGDVRDPRTAAVVGALMAGIVEAAPARRQVSA